MTKYHINSKGEASKCSATQGKCPFANDSDHYESAAEARTAFEKATTKKRGLFARLTSKKTRPADEDGATAPREPAPDYALNLRKFDSMMAIGRRHGWERMKDGTIFKAAGSYQNTFQTLNTMVENDRAGGTLFERADRLKSIYRRSREAGEVETPSFDPDTISREAYLQMVAPATQASVAKIQSSLKDEGWLTQTSKSQVDTNHRVFSKLLKLDMDTEAGKQEAVKALQADGWVVEAGDADALADAVKKGQAEARTYDGRFEGEQERLF